jgi:hypothetical protein
MDDDEHSGDPLDAVTIAQTGYIDTIWCDGQGQWKCCEMGGLAGTIGTMVAWQSILIDRAKKAVPVKDSVATTSHTQPAIHKLPEMPRSIYHGWHVVL